MRSHQTTEWRHIHNCKHKAPPGLLLIKTCATVNHYVGLTAWEHPIQEGCEQEWAIKVKREELCCLYHEIIPGFFILSIVIITLYCNHRYKRCCKKEIMAWNIALRQANFIKKITDTRPVVPKMIFAYPVSRFNIPSAFWTLKNMQFNF